jgi:hypothetical protein
MRNVISDVAAPLVLGFLALGCSDSVAAPEAEVLLGQYGSSAWAVELLATRAGVELHSACGQSFVATRPAVLGSDGSFLLRGRWYQPSGRLGEMDATLKGTVAGDEVQVTLSAARPGAVPAEPLTLRRGESYEAEALPCAL